MIQRNYPIENEPVLVGKEGAIPLSSLLPKGSEVQLEFGEVSRIMENGNVMLKQYDLSQMSSIDLLEWLHEIAHLHSDNTARYLRDLTGNSNTAIRKWSDATQLLLINDPEALRTFVKTSEISKAEAFKAHKFAVLLDELATWEALVTVVIERLIELGFEWTTHFPDVDKILDYIDERISYYQKGIGYIFDITTPDGREFLEQENLLINKKMWLISQKLDELYMRSKVD